MPVEVRNLDALTERFVTMHIQRDKRITLGTCVHKDRDCHHLKSRTGIQGISGAIVQAMPKCSCCYARDSAGHCEHERDPRAGTGVTADGKQAATPRG